MSRARKPERTCIGCRQTFAKDAVVRIVLGPAGPLIDYREKLPGRAAYVCPKPSCIEAALAKGQLARAFRTNVPVPDNDAFLAELVMKVRERMGALLSLCRKAGMLVSGYSAVDDALRKGRVSLLIFAEDISDSTKGKVLTSVGDGSLRTVTVLNKDELGAIAGRESAGVAAIAEKGFADAVGSEVERLKGLLKEHR